MGGCGLPADWVRLAWKRGGRSWRGPDSHDHARVGHASSVVAGPELCVLAPVLEGHKADARLDAGEHVADMKVDIVVPLLDRGRRGRELVKDGLAGV